MISITKFAWKGRKMDDQNPFASPRSERTNRESTRFANPQLHHFLKFRYHAIIVAASLTAYLLYLTAFEFVSFPLAFLLSVMWWRIDYIWVPPFCMGFIVFVFLFVAVVEVLKINYRTAGEDSVLCCLRVVQIVPWWSLWITYACVQLFGRNVGP